MICDLRLFFGYIFLIILPASTASTAFYDTTSNLTHTCKITPMLVCVDVAVVNKTCVKPSCLIYSGGNYSTCTSPLVNVTAGNLTVLNNTTGNMTGSNSTVNTTAVTTILTCNATWIHPSNTSLCFNATSWNKTVCGQNNVTCKINSTKCTLNSVVYVGGFFNLRDKDGYGNLPAAQLALNQINNDNKTLENITLSLVAKQSTQSLLSYGTQLLYNYLHSGPTKLMLLLPQESDLARTVAAYAGLKRWGTLQFSYGTKDNSLASNKQLFPRFYRLNPLAITYNRLRAEFVNSFGADWKLDVGLLYYADSYYQEVNDDLKEKLKAKGINVVANVGFRSDPAEALYILKEKNAHIILTSFPYWYGKKMFCKAFQLGMYGPHYVWITFDLMPYKFWVPKASDNLECSEDEITCIAENHFSFHGATLYKTSNYLINEPNVTFSKTYNDLVNTTKNRTWSAPYVYDAIWTMTNILERARPEIEKKGKVLSNLSYGEETELLEKLANETDFNGLTGRVRFYENGNRKFAMQVVQVRRNGLGYIVGSYNEATDVYKNSIWSFLWQGFKISEGGWSYKRTTETYKWRYIELALFIVWCILAILGMLYAIFCLVFVIKYRRERSIKYSSPTINVLIILGCLLSFIAVVLYGVDYQRASETRMTVICKVRLWIFSLGFTFCVGGLWVKVWTLYQILIERKVYRKRRMEYWMFAIVMILLVIDVVYLTIWTAIDGLYRSFETVTDQPTYKCFQKLSGNPFISSTWYIEICDCDNLALWSSLFLTYKALVLLFGAYMAWKVRHVYTRKLVDAQYCATLLLLAVPFCVLGLIFAYTLRLYPTPHYAMLGIIIILYTYIVLGFLYGHKIINIFCCPRNIIKVRSKDNTGRMNCCCSGVIAVCCTPIAACLSACCCCICCPLSCCKVLWDALLHGPRKNRGSFVKENEKMDYQIGEMPGDRERQIIILQREVEKREEELKRLRGNHRATLAVKETQTMDYLYDRGASDGSDCSGLYNEGFADEENNNNNNNNNNNKQRTGRPNHNRFKVYHKKLDFSHVGSKVDSRLDAKCSTKRDGLPIAENGSEESRRGSDDSEILLLQKTLSERDKELAQLKAYLAIDPSSSTECSSKIGSLASIGEEQDLAKTPENEVLKRNISSVAITIQSSDSDGDSKQTGSDISNDDVPSDVSNGQSVGLLGDAAVNQEIQQGIYPDTAPVEEENEVQESEKDKKDERKKDKAKSKVLTAYGGSLAYVSHYKTIGSGGKFKKKVRQLTSFGLLARKPTNNENPPKVQTDTNNSPAINLEQASMDSRKNVRTGPTKVTPDKPTAENNTSGGSGEKSRNNVKIFNAPTNWSHVKSRLLDPNASSQSSLRPSPNMRRKSKVGIEDDGEQRSGENISGDGDNDKNRNGVKIFNAPSDYSHVKSRVFDPNAASGNQSESNLRPNIRQKSKVGTEDDGDQKPGGNISGDGDNEKNRNGVKIFNSSSDYSHVKSRLYDPNSSGNQSENNLRPSPNIRRKSKAGVEDDGEPEESEAGKIFRNAVKIFNSSTDYSHVQSRLYDPSASGNSDNLLKPSPNIRRKSKVGIDDDVDSTNLSSRRGSVKIFNASSSYSHVKSRLFDPDAPSSRRSSQVNPQDINNVVNKQEKNEQEKENQVSKSRVKIFNAPSDYSHVKSRLSNKTNTDNNDNKFQSKVQEMSALGALKNTNISEQDTQNTAAESTNV